MDLRCSKESENILQMIKSRNYIPASSQKENHLNNITNVFPSHKTAKKTLFKMFEAMVVVLIQLVMYELYQASTAHNRGPN